MRLWEVVGRNLKAHAHNSKPALTRDAARLACGLPLQSDEYAPVLRHYLRIAIRSVWIPGTQSLYRAELTLPIRGAPSLNSATTANALGPAMGRQIAGVNGVTRLISRSLTMTNGVSFHGRSISRRQRFRTGQLTRRISRQLFRNGFTTLSCRSINWPCCRSSV